MPDHRSLGLKKEANASELGVVAAAKERDAPHTLQDERRDFHLAISWGDKHFERRRVRLGDSPPDGRSLGVVQLSRDSRSHHSRPLPSPSASKMPGTHLLPPNLLKLFAPRPALPYFRPVGKDIDRVTKKSVSGVGQLLEQLRESKTAGMISSGEAADMEDGEEPSFTFAEETRRQIRREERKRRREEQFKVAKDTCNVIPPSPPPFYLANPLFSA